MSNSVSFVGRLGNDAELKHVGENTVLEFRVANNVGFGEKKSTNWFRCALWGKQGQSLSQYLVKGKQVWVAGELTLREFDAKDGTKKISAEVRVRDIDLVGDRSSGGQDGDGAEQPARASRPAASHGGAPAAGPDKDGDMPF